MVKTTSQTQRLMVRKIILPHYLVVLILKLQLKTDTSRVTVSFKYAVKIFHETLDT